MDDQEIKTHLMEKMQAGEFGDEDIPAFLELLCHLGNEVEDMQDEVEGWDRSVQLRIEGLGEHWINIQEGVFSTGAGSLENPDLVLSLSASEAAQVFSGTGDAEAAYLSGALKVQGELVDAARLQTLIELSIEEIEG